MGGSVEELEFLKPVAALLLAGIVSATLAQRFHLPAMLGYLATGLLLGPFALGIVPMSQSVQLLAEFGVVFLMFDIGLHFSVKDLWRTRRQLFGLGPLQVITAGAVIAGLAMATGLPAATAALVGVTLALSSTAVVLQILRERGELDAPLGRDATAVLLFQDLAAIFLLALAGTGTGEGGAAIADIGMTMLKAGLAIAAVAVLGRALRPLFRAITAAGATQEFTATALLIVVLTAGATGLAGLSLPLGAFLGGMVLSESEYCYMVKTELKPFRSLLLGLFFVTVGMSLDQSLVARESVTILAVAVAFMAAKAAMLVVSARLVGASTGLSARLALTLAQGSEFAFVVLGLLTAQGGLTAQTASILTAAVVLSMATTPLLIPLGAKLGAAIERRELGERPTPPAAPRRGRVLVHGADDRALTVANALAAMDFDYLALDTDPRKVAEARARGIAAAFGDATDGALVRAAGEHATTLVLDSGADGRTLDLVRGLAQARSGITVLTRAENEAAAAPLRQAGAVVCVASERPDDKTLAAETLRHLGVDDARIEQWRQQFETTGAWEKADKAHAF
jgi:K+:H+ antiporter